MSVHPLESAAFGDEPGRWPLPPAVTPRDRWLRAVAAGGQGRYGAAATELALLRRDVTSGPLASLGCTAQASFVRQLGGHVIARQWDGRALALAGGDPEATLDAYIGLGADALGVGRFAVAAALLGRAQPLLETARARLQLRGTWVAAELAMVSGDGATAARHAERAAEMAVDIPSARHRVKTDVVFAAALCSVGDLIRAHHVADRAFTAAGIFGLIPLRWAAACILADLGGDTAVAAVRDACATLITRRGGAWRP